MKRGGAKRPVHLGQEKRKLSKKQAAKICMSFYDCYGEDRPGEKLWLLVTTFMKSDSEEITGLDRANMIYFYEQVTLLFKALKVLLPMANNH